MYSQIDFSDDDWYCTFGYTNWQYKPDDDPPDGEGMDIVPTANPEGAAQRERYREVRHQHTVNEPQHQREQYIQREEDFQMETEYPSVLPEETKPKVKLPNPNVVTPTPPAMATPPRPDTDPVPQPLPAAPPPPASPDDIAWETPPSSSPVPLQRENKGTETSQTEQHSRDTEMAVAPEKQRDEEINKRESMFDYFA